MKKMRLHLFFGFLLLTLMVGGCSTLYLDVQESAEINDYLRSVDTVAEVADKAKIYKEQGDIIKALVLLKASEKKFPEDENLNQLALEYGKIRERQQLILEMQLLLIESRRLVESIPILEELAEGQPNSHFYRTQVSLWRSYLDTKEAELIACGSTLEEINIWLAKRCLSMAYRISETGENKQRLVEITNKIDKIEQAITEKLQQKEERERDLRIEQLLSEAMQEREQGELISAKEKIDEALKQDPESPQVRAQLSELQQDLNRQVDLLMKLGDKLYRNQQTKAAITAWEAALKLNPSQQQVTERIDRARTVLKKLESIRSTDGVSASP